MSDNSFGHQFAEGNIDGIDEFTDLIQAILNKAWGNGWGIFSQEYPTGNDPSEIQLPQVTYDLFHRIPSKSMKTLKPKLLGSFIDPVDGASISTFRQWFDCLVDFGIWHRTNREAEALKKEFETLMLGYSGYFKQMGVSELLFVAEMQPTVSTKWRQDIPHRALRYLVRIERVQTIRSAPIQEVLATVDLARPDGTPMQGDQPMTIAQPATQTAQDPFLQTYYQYYPNSPSDK